MIEPFDGLYAVKRFNDAAEIAVMARLPQFWLSQCSSQEEAS
jgi:hypothetical protein